MKKYLIVYALVLCTGMAWGVCKPASFPDRWMRLTTDIGGEGYIDYLKITSANTCGEVTAVNEYGSTFSGMRKLLTNGHWLISLHKDCDKYYIDEWIFTYNPGCFNAKICWQTGVIQGDCRCKLRSYANPSSFVFLKKGEIPPVPIENEDHRQYSKRMDQR